MDHEEMIGATEDGMEIEENMIHEIWRGDGVEVLIFIETGIVIESCIDDELLLHVALIGRKGDFGVLRVENWDGSCAADKAGL